MDDWVILAKTRQILARLCLLKHPDKTQRWRTEKGFDFLGCFISKGKLHLSKKTIQNAENKIHGLYEQHRPEADVREYLRRWERWCRAGLDGIMLEVPGINYQGLT